MYQFEVSVCDVRAGNCQKDFVDAQEGAATATFDGEDTLSLCLRVPCDDLIKQVYRSLPSLK